MSDVIHRTERDSKGHLLQRFLVNTPDYDQNTWLVNPDLSGLSGVDKRYWKVTGTPPDGSVVEMTQTEKDDADVDPTVLENTKIRKKQEIDDRTEEKIGLGFSYDGHTFSLSMQAQTNLDGLVLAASKGMVTFPHYMSTTDDSVEYEVVDEATLNLVYMQAVGTIKYWYDGGRTLKVAVRDATTIPQVEAIVDPRG